MAIELIRIDDRLIHGQVATAWIRDFNIEQVIIVNDFVKNDLTQQSIIAMTSPTNVIVKIFDIKEFSEIIKITKIKRRTMILFTSIRDIYDIWKRGMEIQKVNVGGIRYSTNKKKISKSVFIDETDVIQLKEMISNGIMFNIQMIPQNEIIDMKELI